MRRVIACVLLAGCQALFPLTPPDGVVTGDRPVGGPDGLITPPDGTTPCAALPIGSWSFSQAALPYNGPSTPRAFAFYDDGGRRAIIGTDADEILDVNTGGTGNTILGAPPNASVQAPRVSYDGSVLWFAQVGVAGGVYLAVRGAGFTKQHADLGFIDAQEVEPGSIGFRDGAVRMVVSVTDAGGAVALHEISSLDGEHWTELTTIQFSPSGIADRNPVLSPDGCQLVYTASNGSNELRHSTRESDGTFKTVVKLDNVSALTTAPSSPVFEASGTALWFASVIGGSGTTFFRGE